MASPNPETQSSSMFMQKSASNPAMESNSPSKSVSRVQEVVAAEITIKDFFDFMKTAYQVYEHLEGTEDSEHPTKIDWDELTKLTVINHVLDQKDRDLLNQTVNSEPKVGTSKSEYSLESNRQHDKDHLSIRFSCTELDEKHTSRSYRRRSLLKEIMTESGSIWPEASLKSKLNDVINEGILDAILPYMVGHKKPTKTTSCHQPIIKKSSSTSSTQVDMKKPASFGGFLNERESVTSSRDRLGRRKSSLAVEKSTGRTEGEVEIHVCDEVKGLNRDFKCPQKLLVSKMGYFADVTCGQKLEDMDISVHCDIQIFDWLMRWVKRDTILVADWPLLDPSNVIPILVSASFLQMDPLLHDCLIYCHAHMNDIVKTSTNLACLSDTLLTRLAAMYTNSELELIKDRKDKIQSRLFCKMITSLAEPVPETLRGHYSTLATIYKCSKCNKLLGHNIAERVPCQPSNMRIDNRGNVLSTHYREQSWNLNEYIAWLHGELRSWRRVYWRLWGDCHFLKCTICDSFFPAYQMEWCCYHIDAPQFFTLEPQRAPLPIGRHPCCGERAYRFELLSRNTGCQFREHSPSQGSERDAAVIAIYTEFREVIAMKPPQLMFPERLTRLVAREQGEENGRLPGKEIFWWDGIQLAPSRQPFGLLGKLYTGNTKFNPSAIAGPVVAGAIVSNHNSMGSCSSTCVDSSPARRSFGIVKVSGAHTAPPTQDSVTDDQPSQDGLKGSGVKDGFRICEPQAETRSDSDDSDSSSSDSTTVSGSEESGPDIKNNVTHATPLRPCIKKTVVSGKRRRGSQIGRHWAASLSARSNQDGQRRYEERALRTMRVALARRTVSNTATLTPNPRTMRSHHLIPSGGIYVRLEAEWRETFCPPQPTSTRTRNAFSAKQIRKELTFGYQLPSPLGVDVNCRGPSNLFQ